MKRGRGDYRVRVDLNGVTTPSGAVVNLGIVSAYVYMGFTHGMPLLAMQPGETLDAFCSLLVQYPTSGPEASSVDNDLRVTWLGGVRITRTLAGWTTP